MGQPSSLQNIAGAICILLLALLPAVVLGQPDDSQTEQDSIAQDSVAKVVLAEETAALIPAQYTQLIIEVNEKYVPDIREANSIIYDPELRIAERKYDELMRLTRYVLYRNNVLAGIRSIENKWREQLNDISAFADKLENSTSDVIELKKELTGVRASWIENREKLEYGVHPDRIINYVNTSVDTIDHFLEASAEVIDTVTVLYSDVVELLLKTREQTERFRGLRQRRITAILTEREEPIWKATATWDFSPAKDNIEYLRTVGWDDFKLYFEDHSQGFLNTGLFLLFALFAFFWARHRSLMLDDEEEPELVRNEYILKRPFIMSVLMTLVAASFFLPNTPPLFRYFSSLVLLICFTVIIHLIMSRRAKWIGYLLSVLYVVQQVETALFGAEEDARWFGLVVSGLLLLITWRLFESRGSLNSSTADIAWQRLLARLAIPLFVLSIAAFGGNIIGYGSLASVLNKGIVLAFLVGMILIALFKSALSILYHFFHTNFATNSVIVKEEGDRLFARVVRILRDVLVLTYIYYCLTFFLLWEPVYEFLQSLWELGYTFGPISLSVGDVVMVVFVVFLFWLIATIVRTLLNRELFTRVNTARGVGNAIASITHYTIIVLGIFLALASAGFDVQHLGILAGALGVGIGFGLQAIVNNFLSGLILVFERPITVDDVVEVDGILGVVTNIGIRASTIKQYNGDEVIVPNADLISKRVTNRTLSDKKRRYTTNIETSQGVDADLVLKIMADAAKGVEGVLEDPPATAYFKGTRGQVAYYYINYWGSGNFLELMSNVEKAIYQSLGKHGIGPPIPTQIELHRGEDD